MNPADNSVHACGGNYWGQRGAPYASLESNHINLPTTTVVARVAVGSAHALVLLEDNSLVAWGRNDDYQLGLPYSNWTRSNSGVHGLSIPKIVFKFENQPIGSIVAGSKWNLALQGALEPELGHVDFRKEMFHSPLERPTAAPSTDQPTQTASTSFATVAAVFSVVIILLITFFIVAKRRQKFLRVE